MLASGRCTHTIYCCRGSLVSLFTNPSSIIIATTESFPLTVDFTNYVVSGDVVSSPSVRLFDTTAVQSQTITTTPSVSSNTVLITVKGSDLVAGHDFRLDVTANFNASKTLTASVTIQCPY